MIYCRHWLDCGVKGGGCCALKLFGGKPSNGVCGVCDKREPGLGDAVAKVLDVTGIGPAVERIVKAVTGKSCGGCQKRRQRLNRLT